MKKFFFFLLCASVTLAFCSCRQTCTPKLKIGVVSDVHILANEEGAMDTKTWETALNWYDQQGIDAMVCAGDMAQFAQIDEFAAFANTWFKVFPGNTATDGRHVEPIFIYGNHDLLGWEYRIDKNDKEAMAAAFAKSVAKDPTGTWKTYMQEDYAPYFVKDVKGYKFLCMHWAEEGKIGEALAKYGAQFKGKLPFFVVQHAVLQDTVNGPWSWGQDEGYASKLLREYPNAVALCGHSHMPLSDETTIWQDDFTAIGTSSLRDVEPRRGRENHQYWGAPVAQMPQIATWNADMQGMLITIYEDRMVVERLSFKNDIGKLGEDWIIPLSDERPFKHAVRKAEFAKEPPRFTDGANELIKVRKVSGKNAKGEPTEQIEVEFPTANAGKNLPMDYEVSIENKYNDAVITFRNKRVFAPDSWKRDSIAREVKTAKCVFGQFEVPMNNSVRIAITPIDYFGNRGETIYSGTMILDKLP